jgi:hypothetical protein
LRARGGLAVYEAVYDSFNDLRAIPIRLMRATSSMNAQQSP